MDFSRAKLTWILGGLILSSCGYAADQEQVESLEPLLLTEKNYQIWADHILPAKVDLGWQQIPWKATFQEGLLEANRRQLPLLLWTMNGHPLGCT